MSRLSCFNPYTYQNQRRRNQQRLAQQAYRARKENGISRLRKRINQLEAVNDETSNAILVLCDTLLESDIMIRYPQITPVLYHCLSLSKSVHSNLSTEDIILESDSTEVAIAVGAKASTRRGEKGADISTISMQLIEQNQVAFRIDQSSMSPTSSSLVSFSGVHSEISAPMPSHAIQTSDPSIAVTFPISAYISYKSEPNFSHFLVRASFQRGYQVLNSPFTDSEIIEQIYGHGFSRTERQRVQEFLRQALSKLYIHLKTVVDAQEMYDFCNGKLGISHNFASGQDLLDASTIQQILYKRGIPIQLEPETAFVQASKLSGLATFDMRSFIACMSILQF